jgi:hypothetical protein
MLIVMYLISMYWSFHLISSASYRIMLCQLSYWICSHIVFRISLIHSRATLLCVHRGGMFEDIPISCHTLTCIGLAQLMYMYMWGCYLFLVRVGFTKYFGNGFHGTMLCEAFDGVSVDICDCVPLSPPLFPCRFWSVFVRASLVSDDSSHSS